MIPVTTKNKQIDKNSYVTYIFVQNDYFEPTLASKTYKNWYEIDCSIGQSWYHVQIPSEMAIRAKTRSKMLDTGLDPCKTYI